MQIGILEVPGLEEISHLVNLNSLSLTSCGVHDNIVQFLARVSSLRNITNLTLHAVGTQGMMELAEMEQLSKLTWTGVEVDRLICLTVPF